MIMSAAFVLVVVSMIMSAAFLLVIVPMIMSAAFMLVIVPMIMPATFVLVIVPMVMVVIATVRLATSVFGVCREQIEKRHDRQADARDEHHLPEDAVGRQISGHPATHVEVEEHGAPQQQDQNAEKMNDGASSGHGGVTWWRVFESRASRAPTGSR